MSAPANFDITNASGFDEANFRKTLVYERRATVPQLQNDLAAIKALDLESQKQASKWGWFMALGVVGTFICGFLAVVCIANHIVLGVAACGGIAVTGVILAFYAGTNYFHYHGTDVENRRYELAGGLLKYLSADIRSDTEVALRLVFDHYQKTKFLKEKMGNTSSYELPWLEMKGKFADGSRFAFTADLKVKRKVKPKRKYTKVKEDISQDLTLDFSPRNPPADGVMVDHLVTIPPPPLGRYRAQVNNGTLTLRAVTAPERRMTDRAGTRSNSSAPANMTELDQFLRLFLTAYHCWNTVPRRAAS